MCSCIYRVSTRLAMHASALHNVQHISHSVFVQLSGFFAALCKPKLIRVSLSLTLSRGKFAAVRRAIHKNTGLHFAAKFLKRRRRAQSSDKEIKHEIAVLMLCEGEDNIVNLNAVHETRSDTALLLEL